MSRRRNGKWLWPDSRLPKTGWTEITVEKDDAICAMCEVQHITAVHQMRHPDYPDDLLTGCDCAGDLQGDPAAAKASHRAFMNRQKRCATFAAKGWRRSGRGNEWRMKNGLRIVIAEQRNKATLLIYESYWDSLRCQDVSDLTVKQEHDTPHAAKLAAFDIVDPPPPKRETPGRGNPGESSDAEASDLYEHDDMGFTPNQLRLLRGGAS